MTKRRKHQLLIAAALAGVGLAVVPPTRTLLFSSLTTIPVLSVTPIGATYQNTGDGGGTVTVMANGAWTAKSDSEWLRLQLNTAGPGEAKGSTNASVPYYVAMGSGYGYYPRYGHITVQSGGLTTTHTVTQMVPYDVTQAVGCP